MELRFYLDVLRRHALMMAITPLVALLVVLVAALFITPVYTATTTVRVILDVGLADFILREDYNTRLLNTYAEVLESRPILTEALQRLAPRTDALTTDELRLNSTIAVVPDTELITIAVQNQDPVLARDLANTMAMLLIEYTQNLYVGSSRSTQQILEDQLASVESGLESDRQQLAALVAANGDSGEIEMLTQRIQSSEDAYVELLDSYETARLNESLRANSVTVIAPAIQPRWPSNNLRVQHIALSLVIGLCGGIGLALVLENMDTRIHSPQQLERLVNLPALGAMPRGLLRAQDMRPTESSERQSLAEAYRLLSINLQALKEEAEASSGSFLQTILVTSAMPQEGKSTVAINLAQAFAERGQAVFLVECDLRRPVVSETFGLQNEFGLSNLLAEHTLLDGPNLGRAIHPAEQPSLFIIGSGSKAPNPTALLASPFTERLIEFLGAQAQITILDAPPVLGLADVSVLAPRVDGIILVVREGFSRREYVRQAIRQLQATRARVLGVVFVHKSSKGWDY